MITSQRLTRNTIWVKSMKALSWSSVCFHVPSESHHVSGLWSRHVSRCPKPGSGLSLVRIDLSGENHIPHPESYREQWLPPSSLLLSSGVWHILTCPLLSGLQ